MFYVFATAGHYYTHRLSFILHFLLFLFVFISHSAEQASSHISTAVTALHLCNIFDFFCQYRPIHFVAITNMRFPVGDLSACVNQLCVKEWQQLWNQCTSNKLYSVQPVVGHSVSSSLGHYDSVLINRLRIGHTRLTNSYLLKGESQPVCEACHSPLTVKHFLVDCTRYSAARQRYFGVNTLKDVFENVASRNIIAYVKDISFYNRI